MRARKLAGRRLQERTWRWRNLAYGGELTGPCRQYSHGPRRHARHCVSRVRQHHTHRLQQQKYRLQRALSMQQAALRHSHMAVTRVADAIHTVEVQLADAEARAAALSEAAAAAAAATATTTTTALTAPRSTASQSGTPRQGEAPHGHNTQSSECSKVQVIPIACVQSSGVGCDSGVGHVGTHPTGGGVMTGTVGKVALGVTVGASRQQRAQPGGRTSRRQQCVGRSKPATSLAAQFQIEIDALLGRLM